MPTPPEKNSAKHVHRQPRRHEIVGAVALFDDESDQPDDDAPVQRFRVPWAIRGRRWNIGVVDGIVGEEGLICHGAEP
jgi:hypothetical protein